MYNYQAYLLSHKKEEEEIIKHNETIKQSLRHTKNNKSLVSKQQERLERIIRDASEGGTVVINKPFNPILNVSRSSDKSKNIGPQSVIYTDRTESERMKRKLIENSYTDGVPISTSPSRHQFRQRIRSRQIQPQMRYTPTRPLERVIEKIKRGDLHNLDPADQQQLLKIQKQKLNRSSIIPQLRKKSFLTNQFARHVFDNLHKRTYFKTIQQTALNVPGSEKHIEERRKSLLSADVFTPRANRTITLGNIEKARELSKMSKGVLLNAGYIVESHKNKEAKN